WLLRPLPGDMSDFWLLTARELSVLKILMQGMSFSEIARYEQRSSKTLHAIATQALRKLGLGTLSDFRLLYTGCGDSRVKRNIRLHARYVRQHSAHRLTQYVQNMVSGILYPEKVAVGESINSDAISGKVLSGQRKNMSKKRPGVL
ncbi:LuxR family transcriptional regulator HyxR, partial [Escherichia coli]|nr:LuxR family transcriptional regulator [Escherichia coli]EJD5617319.1 LuxR family transcriptional regulator HyxR [Escherichia coli]